MRSPLGHSKNVLVREVSCFQGYWDESKRMSLSWMCSKLDKSQDRGRQGQRQRAGSGGGGGGGVRGAPGWISI